MSALGRAVLAAMVVTLRDEPELTRELRELLGVGGMQAKADAPQVFMRVRAFAERVQLSERTLWKMVSRGLPTIGVGRSRRVDVERADAWLRNERTAVDDSIERSARESARRTANRASRVGR
jgi:hypothetical protein